MVDGVGEQEQELEVLAGGVLPSGRRGMPWVSKVGGAAGGDSGSVKQSGRGLCISCEITPLANAW
jgi:hypothetical protein